VGGGARLSPGEWVQYTRKAIDMMHMPGDESDRNPYLFGQVVSVKGDFAGGVVVWRHQRGESKCLGLYLCRRDTDTFRESGCDGNCNE
jgi:hypothetical protein